MSKCSSSLLSDIGVIFEKSEILPTQQLNSEIDLWASNISNWKYGGLISAVWNTENDFLKKKKMIIEGCEYFISNSVLDLDKHISNSKENKLSPISITDLKRKEKSKYLSKISVKLKSLKLYFFIFIKKS